MNSLDKIKQLNPNLANGMIAPEEYDILVVGRKVTGAEGQTAKIKFTETTKPTDAAKAAGVESQHYLRASFTKSGAVVTSDVDPSRKSFKGSKKAQPGNIFKNTQTNLFNFISQVLGEKDEEGNQTGFEVVGDIRVVEGTETKIRPIVRVKATVWGAKVSLTVPKYKLTTRDAAGKRMNLTGPKYDPKTDTYKTNAVATSLTLRFFADIDDLEEIESLAVKQYERFVMPYELGETTTVEVKGNEVKQTVESDPITLDEELPPEEDETIPEEPEDTEV